MSNNSTLKPRPYWHVDAKWIAGLLLVPFLGATLLAYNLVQLTAEEPAIESLSLVLALLLSEGGLDDQAEIIKFQQQLESSPGGSLQPIPGLRVTIDKDELAGFSPREARMAFFRKFAEPIYAGGAEGLAALANDPQMRAQILEGGGMLNLFTLQNHQQLQRGFLVLGVITLFLFIPLIFFSYRFGRLGSPTCVLFAASLPGAILFGFLSTLGLQAQATPPPREAGVTALAGYIASNILPQLAQAFSRTYLILLAASLVLLLVALIGSFGSRASLKENQL